MVADVLTKPLAKIKFYRFINIILGLARMDPDYPLEGNARVCTGELQRHGAKPHYRQQHDRDGLLSEADKAAVSRTGGRRAAAQAHVPRTDPGSRPASQILLGGDRLKMATFVPDEHEHYVVDAQSRRQRDRDSLQEKADKAAVSHTGGRRAAPISCDPRTDPMGRPASQIPPGCDRLRTEQVDRGGQIQSWPCSPDAQNGRTPHDTPHAGDTSPTLGRTREDRAPDTSF